jgi:hypothetical protein
MPKNYHESDESDCDNCGFCDRCAENAPTTPAPALDEDEDLQHYEEEEEDGEERQILEGQLKCHCLVCGLCLLCASKRDLCADLGEGGCTDDVTSRTVHGNVAAGWKNKTYGEQGTDFDARLVNYIVKQTDPWLDVATLGGSFTYVLCNRCNQGVKRTSPTANDAARRHSPRQDASKVIKLVEAGRQEASDYKLPLGGRDLKVLRTAIADKLGVPRVELSYRIGNTKQPTTIRDNESFILFMEQVRARKTATFTLIADTGVAHAANTQVHVFSNSFIISSNPLFVGSVGRTSIFNKQEHKGHATRYASASRGPVDRRGQRRHCYSE